MIFDTLIASKTLKLLALLFLLLPASGFSSTEAIPANWSGRYTPCNHHVDLLTHGHMDLAVKIATANTVLAEEFANAMDFWSSVLDLEWHEVDSPDCAVQLVDGTPSVFDFSSSLSARAQLPDRAEFQGWVAFNPRLKLSRQEMFLDAVHEIGHLLGLEHNPNRSSVMSAMEDRGAALLDAFDLDTLAARHDLRPQIHVRKGGIKIVRVSASRLLALRRQG